MNLTSYDTVGLQGVKTSHSEIQLEQKALQTWLEVP